MMKAEKTYELLDYLLKHTTTRLNYDSTEVQEVLTELVMLEKKIKSLDNLCRMMGDKHED